LMRAASESGFPRLPDGLSGLSFAHASLLARRSQKPRTISCIPFLSFANTISKTTKQEPFHATYENAMEAINGLREKFGGSIGYSNLSKKFYYYINLGFVF